MKSAKSKTRLGPKTPYRTKLNTSPAERDPVQVFCRLRPLPSESDVSCVKITDSNTVVVSAPETAVNYTNRNTHMKSMKYSFKEVFPPIANQSEVFSKVAHPLVENLIKGKNGLLFAYGVTGSGKTYTMTGEPFNCGILPRCLKLIFKTIAGYQAKKYTFAPDKMNMFDVHSELEAMWTRQMEQYKIKAGKKINLTELDSTDILRVDGLDQDNRYAVFITYVEIYNNSVFDLLEDTSSRTFQCRMVREDAARNIYVHGVTELEVKSPDEAYEAFHKGLKRKRMAHNSLNAESSRSHSVFTIRLVQGPVEKRREAVVQDKKCICISQLSLVDLAGSERTNRTKNTGQRLREAGNINNSLMTLRMCMEILRENQINGTNKMVPYRDSKITHLFKNYFDGEGHVRMIVCVNPRAEDYDESLQVMRFAEMASEVETFRSAAAELGIGMTPGRRIANRLYTVAVQRLADAGRTEVKELEMDLGLVYSLGPDLSNLELNDCYAETIINELIIRLMTRLEKREALKQQKSLREEKFRSQLLTIEKNKMLLSAECTSLRTQLTQERKKGDALEKRLVSAEANNTSLQRKIDIANSEIVRLRCEENLRDKEDKIRLVKTDKSSPPSAPPPRTPFSDLSNYPQTYTPHQPHTSGAGIAVSNPRYRRSLSEESGRGWLEHRLPSFFPMGTVLRPNIAKARNITKLTSVKGDVVPTCGGGAQVIFNDVEMLKQGSSARVGPPGSASSTPHAASTLVGSSSCARHSHKRRDPDPHSDHKKFKGDASED